MFKLSNDTTLRQIGSDFLIRQGRTLFKTDQAGFDILSRMQAGNSVAAADMPSGHQRFCSKAADLGILIAKP
ncbi:hypothetical protein BC777_1778 [Yoonia maricola]|uniref:Uncharacterized protein n=1 Tax=Yoonia maricola TaxID=420999 RepID=A0A2M8WPQ8_9RHOB|nr:hypothetical protein BC777_1778 [Yoonia maricola]